MKKHDQYSPPTYNVSTVGYTTHSDEPLTPDYVPVSEDGFQNFGRVENTENLTSSIQYIPAMNNDELSSNFELAQSESSSEEQQTNSGKPLRFRRQPKSDQQTVDNFSKQSHMFFVPSVGLSSSDVLPQEQEDNLNISLGYSVPEFIPKSTQQQDFENIQSVQGIPSSSYQSNFSSAHNSGMSSYNSNNIVQNSTSFENETTNSFLPHPSFQDQQNTTTQREFKPVFIKPKQSVCSRLTKYLVVLIGLAILGAMIYGGVKLWANSTQSISKHSTEPFNTHQNLDNRLEENREEILVDKEESQQHTPIAQPPETPTETQEHESTPEKDQTNENNKDPYNFYDPFKEIKTEKKAPKKKKQNISKKVRKIQIPQEIYDRVNRKKKKSTSNEAKFNFMDKKIEKYLDNLSKKDYNKLSSADKKLIKKYIHLREKESFEQLTKTSSSKYKKKGIKKKKAKTNPYEFDYSKNDNDEIQVSSDPTLPLKTVRDSKGKIQHIDPFGINEHENDEAYEEDVKNYLKNPDYEKYLDKHDEDDEDDDY